MNPAVETSAAPGLLQSLFGPHAHLRELIWRGRPHASGGARSVPSGHAALDAELPGGGWPTRGLIEILAAPGTAPLALLAPALQHDRRDIVVLGFPWRAYPDGWAQRGVDPQRLLCVHPASPAHWLWAFERILKSRAAGCVLGWMPPGAAPSTGALRRLQLAAADTDTLCFVLRPDAHARQASPAPLRVRLDPAGVGAVELRIVKRRGRPLAQALTLALPTPPVLELKFVELSCCGSRCIARTCRSTASSGAGLRRSRPRSRSCTPVAWATPARRRKPPACARGWRCRPRWRCCPNWRWSTPTPPPTRASSKNSR
jgi:hypothetical protein